MIFIIVVVWDETFFFWRGRTFLATTASKAAATDATTPCETEDCTNNPFIIPLVIFHQHFSRFNSCHIYYLKTLTTHFIINFPLPFITKNGTSFIQFLELFFFGFIVGMFVWVTRQSFFMVGFFYLGFGGCFFYIENSVKGETFA